MPGTTLFNVDSFLDKQKVGAAHLKIIALIVVAMMLDGYDILVLGWTLPAVAQSMHVKPQALTGVFVAQQFGLLCGTLFMGPLADRFGRRTVLLTCITIFTALTLATTQVSSPGVFLVIRFISSLFFSAVIPNAIALSSEVAPSRLRAGAVSVVFCGYTAGSFVGASVQAWVLGPFGWQGAFWTGGALGVAVLILLFFFLPESIRFRVQRNGRDPAVARELQAMDPTLKLTGDEEFVLNQAPAKKVRAPVASLFTDGLLTPTLLLWIAYIGVFTVTHIVGSWNVTVLHNLGHLPYKYLASVTATSTTFGIIGTGASGFIIDRFGPSRTMPVFFIAAALCIACYGIIDLHSPIIYLVAAGTSFFSNSGLGAINALGALLYPSRIRATGVSWAAGAGRLTPVARMRDG